MRKGTSEFAMTTRVISQKLVNRCRFVFYVKEAVEHKMTKLPPNFFSALFISFQLNQCKKNSSNFTQISIGQIYGILIHIVFKNTRSRDLSLWPLSPNHVLDLVAKSVSSQFSYFLLQSFYSNFIFLSFDCYCILVSKRFLWALIFVFRLISTIWFVMENLSSLIDQI